ncbi:unnamed protein product [Caenorhabditis brenneri]
MNILLSFFAIEIIIRISAEINHSVSVDSVNPAHKPPDTWITGNNSGSNYGFLDTPPFFHDLLELSGYPFEKSRVVRNGESSDGYSERVTSLARLYNAISLQSELMNGTKTPEDAVLQLLRIGSVKVPDILEFTPDPIISLTEEMEKTRDSIGTTTVQFKNDIILADSLVKSYAATKSFTEAPSLDEFYKKIEELLLSINGFAMKRVVSSLIDAKKMLDKIPVLSTTSEQNTKDEAAYAFKKFVRNIEYMKGGLDDFEKEVPKWKDVLVFGEVDSLKTLKPLEEMMRILSLRLHLSNTNPGQGVDVITMEFSKFSKLVDLSKNAKKGFTLMRGLIRSKTSVHGRLSGVSGLKLLADSVQKDWVDKALPHAGKTHQIVKGLQPIISLGSKLETLDSLLDRIHDSGFLKSFEVLEKLQKVIVNLPSGFESSIEFVTNYASCLKSNPVQSTDNYSPLKDLVKAARTIYTNMRVLRRSKFLERDMKETLKIVESVTKHVAFSDPQDWSKSKEEVVGIYEKAVSDGSLTKATDHLFVISRSLEEFDVEELKSAANWIVSNKTVIDKYWTDHKAELRSENAVSDCMKKLDNSEQASNAVKAVIELLKIDSNKMKAVETGLDFGSKFAKGLKDFNFGSIVESMKNEAVEETSKLNEMTSYSSEDLTGSEIITKIASMLHDSYEFVQFKNRIPQLNVDIEIDKLTLLDPIILKSIEDQWGNQVTFVNQLIESISMVEKFHSSISAANITTFEDYGAPLKGIPLGKIGDGLEQKSNALEMSWPYFDDKEEKTKQEKAKKIMDEMAVLDLDFASHKAKFDGAQGVLEHLQNFLKQQFPEKIEEFEDVRSHGEDLDEHTKTKIIIIICVAVLFAIIVAVSSGCLIYRQKCCSLGRSKETESPTGENDEHEDTQELFYDVVWNDEVEYKVMLNKVNDGLYDDNGQLRMIVPRYFSAAERGGIDQTITIGKYTLTEIESTNRNYEDCINNRDFTKPIIVHCDTGTNRTMSFIGMEYISRMIEVDTRLTYQYAFTMLAEHRLRSFDTLRNSHTLQMGVIYFMLMKITNGVAVFDNFARTYDAVVLNQEGVPANRGGISAEINHSVSVDSVNPAHKPPDTWITGNNSGSNYGFLDTPPFFHDLLELSGYPFEKSRVVRNGESSDGYSERVTSLARLYNAISLQSELMNGTKTPEDAVLQLLRIGSVKVPDILEFTPDPIISLTEEMEKTRDSIGTTTVQFKNDIILADSLVKSYAATKSFTEAPSLDEFYKKIEELLLSINGFAMKRVVSSLIDAKKMLDKIPVLSTTSEQNTKDEAAYAFKKFVRNIEYMKGGLDDFEKEVPKWKDVLVFGEVDSLKTLKPLEEMMRILSLRLHLSNTNPGQGVDVITMEFSKFSKLVDLSKNAKKGFTLMRGLIRSKTSVHGRLSGVSGLKLLADSVQKDWVDKALPHAGKTHQIVKGLQPIISLGSKLETLDSLLDRIHDSGFLKSFEVLEKLQKVIVNLPSGFESSIEFVTNYASCLKSNPVQSTDNYSPLKDLVKAARTIYTNMRVLRRSKFLERDMKETLKIVESVTKHVAFSDPQDWSKSKEEVVGIYEKAVSDGSLTKATDHLFVISRSLEEFDVEELKSAANWIVSNKTVIDKYWTDHKAELRSENAVSDCMKKLDNSEQASNAVKAVIELLKIDSNKMKAVETGLDFGSKFAKGLKDFNFGSIVESMKNEAVEETSKLNEMTSYSSEDLTGSEIITKIASMLHDSYEFVQFKNRIPQLNVDIEIDKLTLLDPIILKSIEDQWGNQVTFVNQLIESISMVEKFHSSISAANITTFEDYGAPLKGIPLGKIGDGLEQKSNALEMSWPYFDDKEEKTKQEKAKKIMDEMAVLDLDFASHKAKFDGAQGVLEHLQNFLKQQFPEKIEEFEDVRSHGEDLDEHTKTKIIIIICVAVLFAIIVAVSSGCLIYRQKCCSLGRSKETESPTGENDEHEDTQELFYDVVWNDEVEYKVMLNKVNDGLYDDNGQLRMIVPRYFSAAERGGIDQTITIGKYTLTEIESTNRNYEDCINNRDFTKPIIVHCDTGTNRTMSFIGMEYISRMIEVDTRLTYQYAFTMLAEHRLRSFDTLRNSHTLQMGVIYFMLMKITNGVAVFDNFARTYDAVVLNQEGVPANRGGISAKINHSVSVDSVNPAHKPPDTWITGNNSGSNIGFLDTPPFFHDLLELSGYPFEKSRVVRNGKSSDGYSERVTSLARLYNAISLQSELMNGTKTPEDAVLQLLSIESVKVSDILKFTPDPVISLIDEMEKARKAIGNGVVLLKEDMILADSLKKIYASFGSFTEVRSVDEYHKTINDFSTSIGDGLSLIIKSFKSARENLEKIKVLNSASDDQARYIAVGGFNKYLQNIKDIKEFLDDFEREIPAWKQFFTLGNVDSLQNLKPIEEMIRIFKLREHLQTSRQNEGEAAINTEFSKISKLVDPSKNAKKVYTLIRGLIRSKTSVHGKVSGVSGLKLLADSVQKDWVDKALPHAGKTHQIVKGLQPIISLGSKLETLDSLLDRIHDSGFLKSFDVLEKIRKMIVNLPSGFENSVNFVSSYSACLENNHIKLFPYDTLRDLMSNAHIIYRNIRVLQLSEFVARDMKETIKVMERVAKHIAFSNPQDTPRSQEEVVGIYEKTVSDGSFTKATDHFFVIFKSLEGFNLKELKTAAYGIVSGKTVIDKYWTDHVTELRNENAVSACMKKLGNSEQASNAAKAVIELLKIDSNKMKAVKTGLDFGSKFAKGLKDFNFGSIVESMKKEAVDETSKLNEMTSYSSEGLTGSEIITKIASMLHDSYEFVQFKSRIPQLNVDIEIDKLTLLDPIILKSIEDQWGNQVTFVNQLIESISMVEKFHSSISAANITTFEDYGAPLKGISLGKIGDGLEQKSNALEMSWPYFDDKEEKTKQEKAKKIMDEMAVLDLDFASHKAKFDGAQGVLEHLQNFLKQQFPEKIEEFEGVRSHGEDLDEHTKTKIIIIICVAVLFAIIVAVSSGCLIYRQKCCSLGRSKETESPTGENDEHEDTQELFYDVVWNDEVEYKVMLNKVNDGLYDDNGQLRMIVPRYFSAAERGGIDQTITIGKYTLTEIESTNRNYEDCINNRDFTKPIIVHCDTGTNRTMSFIEMEYISRMIEVDTRLTYQYAFTMLAEHRLRSFDTLRNSHTLQMGVIYFMLMKITNGVAVFDNFARTYDAVVLNQEGVPANRGGFKRILYNTQLSNSVNPAHNQPHLRITRSYPGSNTGSHATSSFFHDLLELLCYPFERSRVVRDEKSSDEYSKRVTSLARLYNAISLQSELMNGTKTPEDAVLQLLSIGSVKVPDILEFTPDPLITLIDEMEKAHESNGKIPITLKRDMILAGSLIKSYAVMKSFTEAPSLDKYYDEINGFSTAVDGNGMKLVVSSLTTMKEKLDKITTVNSASDDSIKDETRKAFTQFADEVHTMKGGLDAFEKEVPQWKTVFAFGEVDSLKTLKPLEEIVRILSLRLHLWNANLGEGVDAVTNEFSKISKLVDPSKNAEKVFTLMRALIRSKTSVHGKVSGVSGLKLLADSVQKDWVDKALPHAGKTHQIVKGLQPIISLGSKLETLDSLLDRIHDSGFLKSFEVLEKVQKMIVNLPIGFENSVDFVSSYSACLTDNRVYSTDNYSPLKDLVKAARTIYTNMRVLRRSKFLERDIKGTYQELESMMKSIKFTDIQDREKTNEEVVSIYNTLMSSGSLPKVKELLSTISKSLEGFDVQTVKDTSKKISISKSDIDKYWTDHRAELQTEHAVLDCMKKLDNSEQASNAAKAVIELWEIDSNQMEAVKTGLDFGSKFSKGLKDFNFGSIVESMKKEAVDETSKLNEMTSYSSEDLTGSEIITKIASMLHDSYEFVQFKNRIPQLNVDIEIDKLTLLDPIILKSIEDKWGNQGTFVNQLIESISMVEKFHSSISATNITTFKDYGAPLKGIPLGKIGDGLEQKSNALEVSWPYYNDKAEKKKQESAKKIMDEMAVLDLDFASHKAKFDAAQGVLEHLQNFLTQFIEEIEASEATEKNNTTTYLLIAAGVFTVLVAIGAGVLIYMGCKKKGCFKQIHTHTHDETKILVKEDHLVAGHIRYTWVQDMLFQNADHAYQFHANLLNTIKMTDDNCRIYENVIPPRRHPRQSIQFRTGHPMNTPGYHGNKIVTRTGTIFYAMASPTGENEEHEDTQELFYDVVWKDEVEYIVMLNRVNDGLYNDNGDLRMIIPRYFPAAERGGLGKTITIGKYTLTEIESTNQNNEDIHDITRSFTKRVYEIKRTTGKLFSKRTEIRRVIHYSCLHWEDNGIPTLGFQSIYEVMTVVTQSKKPIVVHCDTGTNRTMSFIGMEYISRMIEVNIDLTYQYGFTKLAEHRLRSFDSIRSSYTLQMGVIYFMLARIEPHGLQGLRFHQQMYEAVALRGEGVPADRDRGGIKF